MMFTLFEDVSIILYYRPSQLSGLSFDILWRSWKGLAERDGGSVFEKAEDVKMQHELGQTDEARSASGENGIMFREGSDELKDVVEKMKADVERLHEGELDDLRSGARAIGGRLSELNKAMRLQRAYDMSTVASVTELAKTMLKNGLLSEMLPSNATSNGGDASRVHRDFKAKVHRLTCN